MTAKATRKASETQPERLGREERVVLGERGLQLDEVEGAGVRVEPQDADQKERRGNEGVEEELDARRAVAAPRLAAEHGDEDRHGHQRELPEAVVEDEVERDEDADHRGLLQQEERSRTLLSRVSMARQEASTPMGARKPVSTTSHSERPSTPR